MAGGECPMMIGLREVNLDGCHEGENSEPMPALTLGQSVEQNTQSVYRNSTKDKIGILSHERNGYSNLTWRHEHAQKMQIETNSGSLQDRTPEGGSRGVWGEDSSQPSVKPKGGVGGERKMTEQSQFPWTLLGVNSFQITA